MNDAVGTAPTLTYPVRVLVFEPVALVAVSFTVYEPSVEYVWLGLWRFDVLSAPDPGSPKSQLQLVGFPVEASLKVTPSGAVPVSGVPVKSATGFVPTVM